MNNQLAVINPSQVDISKPTQFAVMVETAVAMQHVLEEFWGAAEQQMLDRGIASVKGSWGLLAKAERKNWKVNTVTIDPYYLKPTADTKKLNAAFAANELPDGADFTTSVYITKRLNKVEA